MVSILEKEADGEVVYLFDPESPHGDESFPFKAIRLRNPTDSVLESGPVTVFSAGRFIGEGLVEPIPARSVAFVPFALDRRVVVERKNRRARRDRPHHHRPARGVLDRGQAHPPHHPHPLQPPG